MIIRIVQRSRHMPGIFYIPRVISVCIIVMILFMDRTVNYDYKIIIIIIIINYCSKIGGVCVGIYSYAYKLYNILRRAAVLIKKVSIYIRSRTEKLNKTRWYLIFPMCAIFLYWNNWSCSSLVEKKLQILIAYTRNCRYVAVSDTKSPKKPVRKGDAKNAEFPREDRGYLQICILIN